MPTSQLSPTERRVLDQLLSETLRFLSDGDIDSADVTATEACVLAPEDARVLGLCGEIAWARGRDDEAQSLLERAIRIDPESADAHHMLARIHEHKDERAAMIEHDLEVLTLDAAADARDGIGSGADLGFIERCAREVLDALPPRFAEPMANVPVVLEPRPSEGLVADGFDPRALGLFEGLDASATDQIGGLELASAADLRPTRIVLFYANLLASCADDEDLAEQVEVTVLHEIGHFFGLDEDEVDALGLG